MLELKERLESLPNFECEVDIPKEDTLIIKEFPFWDNTQDSYSYSADVEIWQNDVNDWGIDWNDGAYPEFYPSIYAVIEAIEIRL